jgi:branched-chain amino acid transport system ATP-binding protein
MPLLELRRLTVRFGGLTAVNDVSFSVDAGEIVGLIGPNGAGKTTCFGLITGFLPPSSGEVRLQDHVITGLPPHVIARRGLSRTFQKTSLFPRLTVHENVMIGEQARLSPRVWPALLRTAAHRRQMIEVRDRADDVLAFLQMSALRDMQARALSYGEQRHLAVAIALAGQPTLLMLDEPAAGLTPAEAQRLTGTIDKIRARGVTVLLVEHDMKVVMGISDRIVVLDHGQKIAEGEPREIRRNPDVIRVYLGESGTRA